MTAQSPGTTLNPWARFRDWLFVWGCGPLIGLLAADVVQGSYNAQLLSLKPALFAWGTCLFCIAFALLCRPRLYPVVLIVLIIPVWRVLDVVVLQRFEGINIMEVSMSTLRTLLMLVAAVSVLGAQKGRTAALVAATVAMIMTTGSVIAESLGWATFTEIPGRFAGFNGHPNFPPILLCEMFGVVIALSGNFKFNLGMFVVAIPGVGLTYGRSGMACLALMGLAYLLANARKHMGTVLFLAIVAVPMTGIGFAILKDNTQKGVVKDKNTEDRLKAIYELDFEKLQSPERYKDLSDAWEGVMQKPVFGQGVGSSGGRWAPHNEIVSIWLELGIPGLTVFVLMHLALAWGSITRGGRAGFCVFAIWFFVPAAQGRIDTMHYWFTIALACHLIWHKHYRFVWQRSADRAMGRPSLSGA